MESFLRPRAHYINQPNARRLGNHTLLITRPNCSRETHTSLSSKASVARDCVVVGIKLECDIT
jgi:hypothetical protein